MPASPPNSDTVKQIQFSVTLPDSAYKNAMDKAVPLCRIEMMTSAVRNQGKPSLFGKSSLEAVAFYDFRRVNTQNVPYEKTRICRGQLTRWTARCLDSTMSSTVKMTSKTVTSTMDNCEVEELGSANMVHVTGSLEALAFEDLHEVSAQSGQRKNTRECGWHPKRQLTQVVMVSLFRTRDAHHCATAGSKFVGMSAWSVRRV